MGRRSRYESLWHHRGGCEFQLLPQDVLWWRQRIGAGGVENSILWNALECSQRIQQLHQTARSDGNARSRREMEISPDRKSPSLQGAQAATYTLKEASEGDPSRQTRGYLQSTLLADPTPTKSLAAAPRRVRCTLARTSAKSLCSRGPGPRPGIPHPFSSNAGDAGQEEGESRACEIESHARPTQGRAGQRVQQRLVT